MNWFYRFAVGLFWVINRTLFGIKITNKKRLNYEGKLIMVVNHKSMWDPIFIGGEFKMELNFFAKAELFKNKFFGWVLSKGLHVIPINRGEADINAIRTAMGVIKSDKCLGLFPEGTRYKDGLGPFQRGFASIAIKTKTPVLPVVIDGNYKLFRKMHMIIGEPIDYRDKIDLKDKNAAAIYADMVRDEMIRLKEEYGIYND